MRLDETTAKRIKLKVGNGQQRKMQAARFLDDFGRIKPKQCGVA
jgi:hypothetical protein